MKHLLHLLIPIFIFFHFQANGQGYKTHYIAPAPWQYWSSANELVLSTNTAGTIVLVKKSNGSLITTLNVGVDTPMVYRFAGNANNLPTNALNTVLSDRGLILESNYPINANLRNVASDQLTDANIKGNAALFSFGDAAVGTAFRVGYYRDGFISGTTGKPVYSVMAIENNTTVKINGTATTTLNAGQSYLFQAAIGSLVETSGPAVMNSGSNLDAPVACGDGVYNPVPPVSALAKEYVVVRGQGNNTAEQTTVVATEPNTTVTVSNFNALGVLQGTNSYTLVAAGSFATFPNGVTVAGTGSGQIGTVYSASRIISNKNIVAYAGTANNCEVDMATLAPIADCGGSQKVQTYKFRTFTGGDLPYFAYIVIRNATDKVYLTTTGSAGTNYTNSDIEAIAGVGIRRQLGSSGDYVIDFTNTNIGTPSTITLTSTSRITTAMVQTGGGFSMSNFISPFPQKALKPTLTQSNCATAQLSADASSTAPYQWYLDGNPIAGATASSYSATQSGTYTVTSGLSCGISAQSLPITVALCNIDRSITKTVDDPAPPVNGSVNFTLTATNTGAGSALGVSVTDQLPSGYTYISHNASAGTSYNSSTGLWSIGAMASNSSITLVITAKVNASGVYTNTATISGTQTDANTTNDASSVSTTPITAITLTSSTSPPSDAQSVCINTAITNITYAIGGTATGATVTGLPAGISASYNASTKVVTISGTPTNPTAGGQVYTVTTTGGSPNVFATGSITVNGLAGTPVFALGSASSRCQGAGTQTYTATAANTTGITYSINTTGSQAVINPNTGEVTFSSLFSGTAIVTATAAGCTPKTATHTITVTSSGTVSGTVPVCSSANGTLTLAGTTASVVRWESSIDNGATWNTITPNVTTTTLNYSNLMATTSFRAVVSGGGCNGAFSTPLTVIVTQRPVVANQSYTLCTSGSFGFAPVDVPTGTTFTWGAPVITGSVTGGTSGTNQTSVTQSLANSGTATGTATYTVTPTNAGCAGTPFTITVTVTPALSATVNNPAALCSGGTFSVTPATSVTGLQYTWTANLTSGASVTGFSDQATPVTAPVSQTLINNGSATGVVRYTLTPTLNGCTGTPLVFDVSVQSKTTPGLIGADQLICSNTAPTALTSLLDGTGSGVLSYRWESSTNGITWNTISGATVAGYAPGALSQNTQFRRFTLSAVNGVTCASAPSDTVTIRTGTAATITTQPADRTVRNRQDTSFAIVVSGGSGATSYQWQVSTDNGNNWNDIANGGIYAGANSDTLRLTGIQSPMDGYRYRVKLTQSDSACASQLSGPAQLRVDTDGDGVSDSNDPDDDNDGIPDSVEGITDKDGDGIPNYLDIDADNDGITDAIESNGNPANDPDFNGRFGDGLFADTDGDGLADAVDPNNGGTPLVIQDKDGDGIPNYLDLDSDADGIPDTYEAAFYIPDGENDGVIGTGPIVDADKDGLSDLNDPDFVTISTNPAFNQDRDFDGLSNYLDIDNDNDGIIDNIEGLPTNQYIAPSGLDTDGDGIDNAYDVNNGGIASGYSNADGGSGPDYIDTDSDNDGFRDWQENNVTSVLEVDNVNNRTNAPGADGIMDLLPDSDHDGLADIYDIDNGNTNPVTYATNSNQTPLTMPDNQLPGGDRDWRSTSDYDKDGIPDGIDLDNDNDGILDSVEGTADADGDGHPNYLDLDSDGDGVPDVIEAGGSDPDNNGLPGTGLITNADVGPTGIPLIAGPGYTPPDKDNDGMPNYLDLDSDGDNIFDVTENGGPDPDNNGIAGSGMVNDVDNDGISDIVDDYNNLLGTTSGIPTGTPVVVQNTDGDALPNYLDLDSDNDGIPDNTEGAVDADGDGKANFVDIDADNDGIVDNIEAQSTAGYIPPSGNDSNNDGLDNAYDAASGGMAIVPVNTDGADNPDYLDLDSDNDNDSDALEAHDTDNDGIANVVPSGTDADNDGLDDAYDNNDTAINPTNGQTPASFPNLDTPGTPERDWREDYNIAPVATAPAAIPVTEDVASPLTGIVFSDADAGSAPVNIFFNVPAGTLSASGSSAITIVSGNGTGNLVLSGNIDSLNAFIAAGGLSYTTALNTNGSVPLTIAINDNGNTGGPALTDTANTTLNITAVNDLPVAVSDTASGLEDMPLNGNLSLNDTLSGDGGNRYSLVAGPAHGTVTVDTSGTFAYVPNADFNGADTFIYQLCDIDGDCDTAMVFLSITPVNDLPVANPDTAIANEDALVAGNLALNDILSGDGGNTFSVVTLPVNGTTVVNTDGTFTYIPAPNYNGADSFLYRLCDVDGDCDTAVVRLTIIPIDDFPFAVNDTVTVAEDNVLSGNAALSDHPSGDGGNVWSLSGANGGATHGQVVMNPDGTYTYTPDPDYYGPDMVLYQLCDADTDCSIARIIITVTPVNDVPVAVNDTLSTNEDIPLTGNVSTNDTCGDGGCSYVLNTAPVNGTLVLNADGTFTYTPNANYNGADSFRYRVCDADGDCDTATAVLNITPVNDVPVAVNDTLSTNEDIPLTGNVSTNDTCGDGGCSYVLNTAPVNGTLVLNADGTFTYTPNANYNGADSFQYRVCDVDGDCDTATAVLNVTPVNDIPFAVNDTLSTNEDTPLTGNVSTNDTCGDGGCSYVLNAAPVNGTLVLNADGTFTYTPNANYNGADSFQYRVCDADGDCDTAMVVLSITPVNDVPVAVNDTLSTNEDTPLTGNVSTNDTCGDGNCSYALNTAPVNGTLVLNADGTFTYTPNADYNGADSFQYRVCDVDGDCDTATVVLNIAPVNDVPVAVNDTAVSTGGNPATGNVGSNDTGKGDGGLSFAVVTGASNGTLTFNPDGTFSYTPATGYNGADTFTYSLCDADGDCDTAFVFLNINGNPLPADLLSFKGRAVDQCHILLEWATGVETQFSHFELQVGIDGRQFVPIARIEATGSNSSYRYTWNDAPEGISYFRLKITDRDNSYKYSSIIPVTASCDPARHISVFPTPTLDKVQVTGVRVGETLMVFDGSGRLLIREKAQGEKVALDLSPYTAGVYHLVILTDKQERLSYKVIKK
ncbi:Ig-like domain-containing protein [Taibaiella koreensis]|uniref:Ig-like domain-containing protein n=1 Tax=Taibaiella koreensis TaxID=1268548 RepID=UPI000E59938A|nr:Ig-like domain-containing protein [Taibaiella koreensis]